MDTLPSIGTRLDGKVAVIVGAGGEIARAIVSRFRAEGATVVGIDRRGDIETDATLFTADMRNEDAVIETIRAIVERFGRIDVLYNNIGPLNPDDRALETNTTDTWEAVFRDLVLPVVLTCKHVVPLMRSNPGGGSIINTGSFLAGQGSATAQTAFNAAKAAVTQITQDLGVHLARAGVRVNSLSLGPVDSPESRAMFERLGADGVKARLIHVPTGRFATPAEVAGAAAFLASDDAGYVTASSFPVNGGIPGAYTIPA
ncbi:SDR family oxidoreductase [Frondihabitans cladoniiphilus]|uniref:3-oxoacyl-ACP reductase n=1 Tax=Frondihabitans cladoniiphilus TaxID=715785 RepID=A0ABP8VNK5_9MICO